MIAHFTAVRIVPNSKLALQARDGSWMSISPKTFEARHPQAAPALTPASTSQPQINMGQCLLTSLTSAPNLPVIRLLRITLFWKDKSCSARSSTQVEIHAHVPSLLKTSKAQHCTICPLHLAALTQIIAKFTHIKHCDTHCDTGCVHCKYVACALAIIQFLRVRLDCVEGRCIADPKYLPGPPA